MAGLHEKINIYISCLLASVAIHVLFSGFPFAGDGFTLSAMLGFGLLLILAVGWFRVLRLKAVQFRSFKIVVSLAAACCVIFPVIWPNTLTGAGLAHAVETTRLWPQILVCLFAGQALVKNEGLNRLVDGRRSPSSIAPYVFFGLALTFGFYAILVHFGHAGSAGSESWFVDTFMANSPIHYLIVVVFFVVISYIVHASIRIRTTMPLIGPIRKFIRTLIGTLPLLGFLGTVAGIMDALAGLPRLFAGDLASAADLTPALTLSLGGISLAFETTLLGLVASLLATLALGYVEKAEADTSLRSDGGCA